MSDNHSLVMVGANYGREGCVLVRFRLLCLSHLLVNRNSRDGYQQDGGKRSQDLYEWAEPIDLGHDLHLLARHVRFGFTEEELVILMHCESAAVDQDNDQGSGEHAPCNQKLEQSRHIYLVLASLFCVSAGTGLGVRGGCWAIIDPA